MPRRLFVFSGLLFALFLTAAWLVPGRIAGAIEATTPTFPSANSSLMFIENVGQFAEDARFQVRGSDRAIWLAQDAIWVTLWEPAGPTTLPHHKADPLAEISTTDTPRRGVNLRLSFAGANPAPTIHVSEPVSTTISYFYGNDPDAWRPDVPVWGDIRYANLYPGLDLELAGQGSTLTPRLICHVPDCATALAAVQLQVTGAEALTLVEESLLIETAVGAWRLPLLAVVDAEGRPVDVDMAQAAVVGKRVERPYTSIPAVQSTDNSPADSDLLYSTFLGGTQWDRSFAIAVDEAGNAFVTGFAGSSNFPTTPGAFDTVGQGSLDIFVTKFNAAGSDLLYSTFLGGEDADYGYAIAVDEAGNAYVTGRTYSPDFPTPSGAFDVSLGGDNDAFVTKLNATGSDLLYSTFLGGENEEKGAGITVDGLGNAFITGATYSLGFPTTPDAFDTTKNGLHDAFITKLNATGNDLLYSTFLGGGHREEGLGIAVDQAGNAFVTGITDSPDFATTPGAFDTTHNDVYDAFITKLNAEGSSLLYSTFLGGGTYDYSYSIAVGETGNAFITGRTRSYDFPTTPGAFDTTLNDGSSYDGFVAQLNAAGSDLLYSTFLGGESDTDDDQGSGIAVDEADNAFVTGFTESSDFPTTPGAFDTIHNGSLDVFVVKFNAAGSTLLYSTFLGGDYGDVGNGIVLDGAGNVFVTGYTGFGVYQESNDLVMDEATSAFVTGDFPTTPGAFDTTFNGHDDGFVTRLVPENALIANFDANPTSGVAPVEVTFSNLSTGDYDTCLWDFGDGNNSSSCLDPVHAYTDYGLFSVSLTITGTQGATTLTRPDYIAVYEYEPVAASFTITPTIGVSPLTIYLTNLSTGDYDTCLWDFGDGGTSGDCDEPSYTYDTPGIYTVSLTVTGLGGEDTFTAVDPITIYEPVTAGFSATPTSGNTPLLVTFTNLSTGDYDTCLWDFGDGSTSSSCGDLDHIYDTPGSYTVSLTVTGLGGEDTFTALIAVYEPVHAHFTAAPTSGLAPLYVLFTNLATGDYTTCQWDFGDGSTSSHCSNPGHTYTTPGSYDVSLTVTGPGGEDTFTAVDPITIYEPVTAGFTATPTSGNIPLLIQFTNLATGDYDTCLWDFGDGNTSEACDNPQHTYTTPGTYTVTFTVSGPGGEDTLVWEDYITAGAFYQSFLPLVTGAD